MLNILPIVTDALFIAFVQGIIASLVPQTTAERFLVEQIAKLQWMLARVEEQLAAALQQGVDLQSGTSKADQRANAGTGRLLAKEQARLQRQWMAALAAYDKMQAARGVREVAEVAKGEAVQTRQAILAQRLETAQLAKETMAAKLQGAQERTALVAYEKDMVERIQVQALQQLHNAFAPALSARG